MTLGVKSVDSALLSARRMFGSGACVCCLARFDNVSAAPHHPTQSELRAPHSQITGDCQGRKFLLPREAWRCGIEPRHDLCVPSQSGARTLMNWHQSYRLRGYIRSSLWVIPFIAIPLELALTRVLHRLDDWLGWTMLGYAVPGAQALLLQTIITAMLTLSASMAFLFNLMRGMLASSFPNGATFRSHR